MEFILKHLSFHVIIFHPLIFLKNGSSGLANGTSYIAVTKIQGTKICSKPAVRALEQTRMTFHCTLCSSIFSWRDLQRLCQLGNNNNYITVTKTQGTKVCSKSAVKKSEQTREKWNLYCCIWTISS